METAVIVKVAVSAAPYSVDKPYDYLVPGELLEGAVPGVRVMIPFGKGNRESEGIILSRGEGEKLPGIKPLKAVLDKEPVLDKNGIALALWMRQRYFCTLFEAVKTILPTGLWYQVRESWSLTEGASREELTALAGRVKGGGAVLDVLFSSGGSCDTETLKTICGEQVTTTLRALQKEGAVDCETDARRRIADKKRRMLSLVIPAEDALAMLESKRRSSPQRYEVVRMLASMGMASAADVTYYTGASAQEEELRVPQIQGLQPGEPIVLNGEQQIAYEKILALTKTPRPEAVLLHGVTGSGKTQVYLRLVQEVLAQGKSAIVLVPEIVLTPQMMRKFSSYFGEQVAMLHSSLRVSERYDQWKRIRKGEVRVVLGTRSAIFSPVKDLGLIILDEEQESSYQSENPPRYLDHRSHGHALHAFRCH